VLNGDKADLNGGIADVYVVSPAPADARFPGISAFIAEAGAPGFEIAESIEVIGACNPLASVRFVNCRIPASNRIGPPGEGSRSRCAPDVFRTPVVAASLDTLPGARSTKREFPCHHAQDVQSPGQTRSSPGQAARTVTTHASAAPPDVSRGVDVRRRSRKSRRDGRDGRHRRRP
jgi:hypothetical protein